MAEKKLYYSMGEVAEMFDVNPSLIRHWESKFDCVKPHKNKKGNRMFSPQDVEKLKLIYHLVKERGMTLEGANKVLKRKSGSELSRDMELLERLQRIRASLVAVREELKGEGSEELVVSETVEDMIGADIENQSVNQDAAQSEEQSTELAEPKAERSRRNVVKKISDDGTEEKPTVDQPKKRTTRRKKKDEEDKELFPFYEQSLF